MTPMRGRQLSAVQPAAGSDAMPPPALAAAATRCHRCLETAGHASSAAARLLGGASERASDDQGRSAAPARAPRPPIRRPAGARGRDFEFSLLGKNFYSSHPSTIPSCQLAGSTGLAALPVHASWHAACGAATASKLTCRSPPMHPAGAPQAVLSFMLLLCLFSLHGGLAGSGPCPLHSKSLLQLTLSQQPVSPLLSSACFQLRPRYMQQATPGACQACLSRHRTP
ncbi:hypothetical protein ABPG75_011735 [Micractinium tetrahymenae]